MLFTNQIITNEKVFTNLNGHVLFYNGHGTKYRCNALGDVKLKKVGSIFRML